MNRPITTSLFVLAFAAIAACLWAQEKGPASTPPETGAFLRYGDLDRYSRNPGTPWPAVDGLGRTLPTAAEVGPPRPDRFVGIFYFLWAGQHDRGQERPYVVADILRQFPNALQTSSTPPWGPEGIPHYWGEPLFGFYLDSDPWILRRHAHLLADAGVDTLIFDTTNANSYFDVYRHLLQQFQQLRDQGRPTPQVVFMVNTNAGERAEEIYEDLYKPGLYSDLWFRWHGKPLMICDPEKASAELRSFFTLRRAHWPFTQVNTSYAWHWEAAYPQHYGFTDDPKVPEEVNVSVAQNLAVSDGKVAMMSSGNARGRSFHDGHLDQSAGAVDKGYNFQEQWNRALLLDPPFVMVTGWNEWIAGRFSRPGQGVFFVDQFSQEYSRDIEPMKGGHGDNYYYELVSNVRRFKGMPSPRQASPPKTIDMDGEFVQWRDVGPDYWDYAGETIPRDYDGVAKLHYTNRTGRNDFELMKVARDKQNIYFYVRTAQPITPHSDSSWMTLLIDSDQNPKTGWQGYDFIVNHKVVDDTHTSIERNAGGWKWSGVSTVTYQVQGREMQITVPRAQLGLTGNDVHFDFKWVDNLQTEGDAMDFYVSGDVAPDGRFNYRYTADEKLPAADR